MALPIYLPFERFIGDGTLATYPFDFKIYDKSEVLVVVKNASGTIVQEVRGDDTTYLSNVTFDSVDGGGEVVLLASLASDYEIFIFAAPEEPIQPSEFTNKRDFSLKRIEAALDRVVTYVARSFFLASRSVRLHDADDAEAFDARFPKGVSSITTNVIPYMGPGGWADPALWPALTDLSSAVAAAVAAAASQAAALTSQTAAASALTSATSAAAAAAASAASAAASAAAASSTPVSTGTYAAPQAVTTQIAFTGLAYFNTWYVQGNLADQTLSLNPRIAAATNLGQKLKVIVPHTATYKVTIPDGNGVQQNGPVVLEPGMSIDYEWAGSLWFETGRNA